MALFRYLESDATSIIESATTRDRRSRDVAAGKGLNWDVRVEYDRREQMLGLWYRGCGSASADPSCTSVEVQANGKSLTFELPCERRTDFFVYRGYDGAMDVSELGVINDISDVKLYLY